MDQVAVMYLACGMGGLLAGRAAWTIAMRPADDALAGILGGVTAIHALRAAGHGALTGAGRWDAAGLLGQISAGAMGAVLVLGAMRLARRAALGGLAGRGRPR